MNLLGSRCSSQSPSHPCRSTITTINSPKYLTEAVLPRPHLPHLPHLPGAWNQIHTRPSNETTQPDTTCGNTPHHTTITPPSLPLAPHINHSHATRRHRTTDHIIHITPYRNHYSTTSYRIKYYGTANTSCTGPPAVRTVLHRQTD